MNVDLVIDAASLPHQAGEAQEAQKTQEAQGARYAALERLVARGEAFAFPGRNLDSSLRELFDLPREAPLPAAAFGVLGEGMDPGSDCWLRLDPVHLRAERSRVLLVPLPAGDIPAAEAEALRAALAPHLAQAGHELVPGASGSWYLRLARAAALDTRPVPPSAQIVSEDDFPSGPDGAYWRRLVTEAQMLLHELPINEAREAQGQLPVNAVWPWGVGRMIQLSRSRYSHAFSNDAMVRGISRASGAEADPLPAHAGSIWTTLAPDACVLTVCNGLGLAQLERDWIAPLAGQLAQGRLEALRLIVIGAAETLARRITRRDLRRFWRRSRPLAHA